MPVDNRCLIPEHVGPESYFVFTGRFRRKLKCGMRNGALGPFLNPPRRAVDDVTRRTHNIPSPQGQLNRVYPDAIEMRSDRGLAALYGHIAVWGGVFLSGIAGFACVLILSLWGEGPLSILLPGLIFSFLLLIVTLSMVSTGVRILKWTPPDAPLLFNRRTREVTVFHVSQPHFFKFWEGARTRISTCPWEHIRVRTFKYLGSTTGGMRCSLFLAWGEPDDPTRFADYTRMGDEDFGIDDFLFAMWEHVRRYMEEDGPAVPHGEAIGSEYDRFPSPFPPDVIEAAGGEPYSLEEVRRMAEQAPDPEPQAG